MKQKTVSSGVEESDYWSYLIIIVNFNNKNHKAYKIKERKKTRPIQSNKKKMTDTIPEKAKTLDLLNKDIKTTVLNILKELKEKMNK